MPNARFTNPPQLATPNGYSQVAEVTGGRLVFLSGQVARDSDGKIVGPNDLAAQTAQVFENIHAALATVGATFDHVVNLKYYVLDAGQVQVVRDVRDRYINSAAAPTSTLVVVKALASPDFLIEVDAVAALP